MEIIDGKMEQRVWQRVRGEGLGLGVQGLAAAEQTSAAVYLMLSRMITGPEKALLRQLFERERSHARCLHGMYYLQNERALSARTAPPDNDRPEIALRKCYTRTLQALRAYEERENDPEFGPVFRQLKRQETEHCRMLLEILGGWKRSK